MDDTLILANRTPIITLALGARLPTIFGNREYVQAGGLMSYGPNFPALFRRAADFVDKILRGAKPGDLPVEQPTKFESRHQSQDRQGAWPHRSQIRCFARRRGDRMTVYCMAEFCFWPITL